MKGLSQATLADFLEHHGQKFVQKKWFQKFTEIPVAVKLSKVLRAWSWSCPNISEITLFLWIVYFVSGDLFEISSWCRLSKNP